MNLQARADYTARQDRVFAEPLALRDADEGSTIRHFEGWASITGVPYEVHDMFGAFEETVEPGAFKRTLEQNPDVQFLVNHGGIALARTKSKTMALDEDAKGLHVDADLDSRMGVVSDLSIALDRRDMDQMSFAFYVPKGGDTWDEQFGERHIHEIKLHRGDVSVVNQGANPAAGGWLRAFAASDVDPDELANAIAALQTGTGDTTPIERAVAYLTSLLPVREEQKPVLSELLADLEAKRYAA